MVDTEQTPLARASELLDKTGANWDRAFRKFADEPTPANERAYQAAQQAYFQAQRTYLLAKTMSGFAPAVLSSSVINS